MKARMYALVERCVEDGAMVGITRAHKHNDDPAQAAVVQEITTAVMNEIAEWFTFEELEE